MLNTADRLVQASGSLGHETAPVAAKETPPCPDWCVLTHPTGMSLWHESGETVVETTSEGGGECLSLKRVNYSWDGDASQAGAFIEIAHHLGERYRLINLSDDQARELAAALLAAIAAGDSAR